MYDTQPIDYPVQKSNYILQRGFDPELAQKYGVTEVVRGARRLLRIEYRDKKGRPSYRKYRTIEGEKTFFREPAGTESHWWNEGCLYDEALAEEPVVICESETDALSAIQCGYPCAVATGGGPGSEDMIRPHVDNIRNRQCIIATDNDPAGDKAFAQLTAWIGLEFCYHLYWDQHDLAHDLNDALQFSETECRALLGTAESCISDGFMAFDDLPPRPLRQGYALPWKDLSNLTLAKGEMTVMTGTPGSGKSLFTRAVACHMADVYDWKVALVSLEDDAKEKVLPQIKKAIGLRAGDADWMRRHFRVIDRLTLLKTSANPTFDFIMDRMALTAREWAADLFILDPWSCLSMEHDKWVSETQWISKCINRMQGFAKLNRCHLWVNAHPGIKPLEQPDRQRRGDLAQERHQQRGRVARGEEPLDRLARRGEVVVARGRGAV
jgi:twinkle protein